MLSEINIPKGFVMYTPHVSTVLKAFIYVVAILLALCCIGAIVGFAFAGQVSGFPLAELSSNLCYIATVLLVIHLITFCFVLLFQMRRLFNYTGYIVLSLIATISYVGAWFATPALSHYITGLFH